MQRSRTPRHLGAALLTAALVLGCASGTQVAYDRVQINLPFVGKRHVAVAALDLRASLKNGEHDANVTGSVRTDAQTASPVATASGAAFADDVSEVIARGLGRSGYRVDRLTPAGSLSEAQVFAELEGTGATHLVLLVIREWQTLTFQNTEVRYDLTLEIRNPAGALQAESDRRGSDQLAPAHSDSEDARERASQSALEQKLNLLFAEPRVVAAFQREL
ncbi:MAG TPA: hypothetical protein VI197_05615 [Polyangiaceae bacterium]